MPKFIPELFRKPYEGADRRGQSIGSQKGKEELHCCDDWQVRVELPIRLKPSGQEKWMWFGKENERPRREACLGVPGSPHDTAKNDTQKENKK